ncbi:hypothetical protein TIFTF001_034067 [Ficus carica]|uniref:J domain-containing protein n=1 Tax=Ficus carica TaxID=3494 RepID=A0AA88JA72_FICCA|nr:hypothetical protein TIFTF001_034067 [Ficus carica]
MEANTSRAEAERLLGVSEKLLQNRDLNGSRDFTVLAQETEPLLDGSDQIIAVVDVDTRCDDQELIKRQYRRLALLLHPDKNKFAFTDQAFKLVAQAWAVLSDSIKKPLYDNELNLFSRREIRAQEPSTGETERQGRFDKQ